MKQDKFCNCKSVLFTSSRHRNPSKVVHMLNQHGWSWDSVQWWHAMFISNLWLSHSMSRMKRQRTCFGILSWESFPSVSCGWADGGSCVNILLYSSSKSDFRLLSHERWYDFFFLGGGCSSWECTFQYGQQLCEALHRDSLSLMPISAG